MTLFSILLGDSAYRDKFPLKSLTLVNLIMGANIDQQNTAPADKFKEHAIIVIHTECPLPHQLSTEFMGSQLDRERLFKKRTQPLPKVRSQTRIPLSLFL